MNGRSSSELAAELTSDRNLFERFATNSCKQYSSGSFFSRLLRRRASPTTKEIPQPAGTYFSNDIRKLKALLSSLAVFSIVWITA